MAPGVNGTGKYTGTVPKSKTHNDGRRDSENRRDASINNIPNNLVPYDWQQIADSSQNLSLKHSNTRTCDSDCFDFDGSSSHELDNRRRRLLSEEQGIHNSYLPAGYPPASIKPSPHPRQLRHNAHRISCFPQQSLHSPQLNHSHIQPRITMASDEEEGASSYDSYQFSQMGERNDGTQGWMDPGGSGEGRPSRNHISPSTSEQQMKVSKGRDERDRNILPDRENKSNISKMPDRNQVLSRLNQIRDYINQTTSLMDRMQTSRDPRIAAEYCKLTKMLQGLRDSEKKLEDLLSTLKNLAECETGDISGNSMAKMKQEIPDGGSSGRNLGREKEQNPQVGAIAKIAEPANRNDLKTKIQKQEIELLSQNDMVNSLPDFSRADLSPSAGKSKLDCLKERIQALKELYENRNQLMELLGDEDEELSSEHQVLQNKIEDLQQKKNQMDQLVQELRSLNCFIPDEDGIPEAANGPQVSSADVVQQMAVGDAENEMPERDIQEVLKNMEELKQMKERLAILQGMITTANQNQAAGGDPIGNEMATSGEKEDHTVNLRRQKEQRRKQQSCSKPDNISLSSEAGSISDAKARQLMISSRELERKTLKLQEAKQRLLQLERLLDVVQENQNDGQGLSSEQYAQLMDAVKDGISQQQGDEPGEQGQLNSVSEGQSLLASKQQRNYGSEVGGPSHSNKRQPFSRSRTSSMHGSEDVDATMLLRSSSPIPSSTELSVEALQAMTQNLKEQAMSIRAERERLAAVKWQIGQRQRSPVSSSASSSSESSSSQRDKNRNTMEMDTQSCRQLLLQAELQAKRRELEELMRKDRGHQASINQDISSEMSAGKSETAGFNHINAEGTTTNATWGGSTQGTLDDLAERDIEVQDQSADYSSDDGRNEEESKDGAHFRQPSAATQDHKITQLNVSLAREQSNERSQSAHREMLNISLESQGRRKGSVNSNKAGSNASSTLSNRHSKMQAVNRSSPGRSPVRVAQSQNLQQNSQHSTPSRSHLPSSHNVWKKDPIDNSGPRAIWTPSSAHGRQENICPADELVAESVSGSNAATVGSSIHPSVSSMNPSSQPNATNSNQSSSSWWQQQAQQLQNQLEATTSLCQSLMTEQQHHSSGSSCPFPGMNPGYSMAHPLGVATPPTASPWPFTAPWMLAPSPLFPAPDHAQTPLALHSCASHQLQQQQQVLHTLSQCCQLLWLQHRELATLQATVQGIQDRLGREPRQEEDELRNIQLQQSQMQQPVNAHPLLYHNRVTAANTQPSYSVPMASSSHSLPRRVQKPVQMPYPEVVREGLVSGEDTSVHGAGAAAASGVASAHSLPNLCASGTAIMGLPHLISHSTDAHPSPTAAYPFPSESLHPPPPPLGPSTYAHGDHWALHPSAAGVARGPPVALNNQVPPGIRANNYWDNFRSYSRQNLLSTSSKSNEGFPHIPSPLVMRSHNFLRSASQGPSLPTSGSPVAMPPAARHIIQCQKEKLNTEQQCGVSQQQNVNRTIPNPSAVSDGSHYGAVGFSSQDLPWEQPQLKEEHSSPYDDSNRRHSVREGSGLFQMLRESVYSEVATLIAQNENRPHYLIQLFRDLQMVSCDALRQRTLLSIHRLVSRYIQENGKDVQDGLQSASVLDSELNVPNPRECDSSGEEEIQERGYAAEGDDTFSSPSLRPVEVERKQIVEKDENQQICHEMVEASIDSCQDGQETMNENIQSMLHQLLPLLKPHLDEPSSFMLLQNICLLAFQFLSSNINADGNKSKDSPLNTSLSFHQLNSLLEETCLRFEGCKLKDVGEELLISIGEVLVKAITSSNQELCRRKMDEDIEEGEEEILEPQEVIEERRDEVAEEDRNAENDESNQGALCDEDLAEADQSLDSNEIIISDVRGPHKRFSISKETKGESKEPEAGTSSYSCDDAFVIIVGTEGEAVGKRIAAESAGELVLHGSEDFVECNGNDNDNTCCNADELGAEALIEDGECSVDRVENESVEKKEIAGRDDQKSAQEHGGNEVSSSSPKKSSTSLPKASSSNCAQVQWAGSDDDTDVVIGDEAGVIESTKGDCSGSI